MIDKLNIAAAEYGLIPRGGFYPAVEDTAPQVWRDGEWVAAKYLLLIGNAGSAMWTHFERSAEYEDKKPDPLNRWSQRIGENLARQFSARAVFPFGETPPRPFLKWAKKAEGLHNSKLGMLIHPRYGLWHAYRFALAFAEIPSDAFAQPPPAAAKKSAKQFANPRPAAPPISAAPSLPAEDICQSCDAPCLRACPVDAFAENNYAVETCANYLQSRPQSECMRGGCLARVACPYAEYRYEPPHAAFHMHMFAAALRAHEFAA